MAYSPEEQHALLTLAKNSIEQGLGVRQPINPSEVIAPLPVELKEQKATFATLEKSGQLRGCIGSLQAVRPLAEDVILNAYKAAFGDPRFQPLQHHEVGQLDVSLSVLSTPERMTNCEQIGGLLEQLQPGIDGLIISDGQRRATFLPSVWKQLPKKDEFILHLMRKAGMTNWSNAMICERYTSDSFGKKWAEI